MKFTRNTKYYSGIVYEWNLPAGHSCPYAKECKVTVNRETGKMLHDPGAFRCYAASAERFPGVREFRWRNYEHAKAGRIISLPAKAKAVRIHASGDFFSQAYFDQWLELCRANPGVEFWAFTKSLRFWIKRRNVIPGNLILTASYGGHDDDLIEHYGLKYARVVDSCSDPGRIDHNDDLARIPAVSFYLLDKTKRAKT